MAAAPRLQGKFREGSENAPGLSRGGGSLAGRRRREVWPTRLLPAAHPLLSPPLWLRGGGKAEGGVIHAAWRARLAKAASKEAAAAAAAAAAEAARREGRASGGGWSERGSERLESVA